MGAVDRTISESVSHEEAAARDRDFYLSLSPAERLDILLELIERHRERANASAEGFARVYRVVQLERR